MRFELSNATDLLSRTPGVLSLLLKDLPREWTRGNEGGDTWSAFDVLGHLIHGERTDWIPRAKIILGENEDRAFEPFDRFAQFRESEGKSLRELLATFEELRTANLRELRSMAPGPEDLERKGTHPELGTVTLSELIATWVVHDLDHVAQVSRVLAKQYADDVGPWQAYIGVLK